MRRNGRVTSMTTHSGAHHWAEYERSMLLFLLIKRKAMSPLGVEHSTTLLSANFLKGCKHSSVTRRALHAAAIQEPRRATRQQAEINESKGPRLARQLWANDCLPPTVLMQKSVHTRSAKFAGTACTDLCEQAVTLVHIRTLINAAMRLGMASAEMRQSRPSRIWIASNKRPPWPSSGSPHFIACTGTLTHETRIPRCPEEALSFDRDTLLQSACAVPLNSSRPEPFQGLAANLFTTFLATFSIRY